MSRNTNNLVTRVDVKVGFSCNNRCLFCVQGRKRYEIGDFTTEEIFKKLEESRKVADSIVFTGGEITIRKDFLTLVRYAKELKFRIIQIQTNARMFAYKKFCEEAIKAGANEFSPALHGHIPQLHDFLTRSKGSFEQTVTAIKNLKSLNQYVLTNTVITKSNYRHLVEIARLLVNLGVDQYQFAFVHPVGTAMEYFERVVPRMRMIEPYVKRGLDVGIKANKRVMTEAIPYCIMKDYEEYIAERIIPVTTIYDANFVVENYTEFRLNEGKKKGPQCRRCIYFKICEGPWREYPERYGFDEFTPVR
jgi:MoaA/NifB/PqqE/SkfB family radical SAM enzyme